MAFPALVAAQTPRAPRSRALRIAVRELPASHDPAITKRLDGTWLDTLVYDALFRWSADGAMMPALALSWSRREFDRLVEVVLRPDAFFPTGRPITAEDARWSLERLRAGGSGIEEAWRLEHVERIEVVDPVTLRIVMSAPDAALIPSLACSTLAVLPAGGEDADRAFGTGPFMLERSTADGLTYRRNPLFWQINRPYIDRLHVSAIADDTTRTTALVTGNVDFIPSAPLLDVPTMRQDTNVSLVGGPSSRLCLLQLNLASRRLQNPAVRQLLARAIDRDRLVTIATAGQAEATSLLFPEDSWARGDVSELRTADPDETRAALADLGVRAELSLRLVADDSDATLANTAVVLQDQLAYAGIALSVDLLDATELAERVKEGSFDLLVGYTPPWRDPHELVRPLLAADGAQNRSGYASPRVDALIRNATLTHDQKRRTDRYARLQANVLADMPVIVLFRPHYYDAMTSRLSGYGLFPPVTSRGLASATLQPADS